VRKILKRWAAEFARDDGVAGLIIAMIIAAVAATTLMVFFRAASGPARELALIQKGAERQKQVTAAITSYFLQQSPVILPCPDTNYDGDADTCAGSGTATGTLPWRTIGMSREDALDAYGRYYTYVVPASAATRGLCYSITNDYNASLREYTGSLVESTALEARTSTQSATQGTYVPFAIIGHGSNGYGARTLAQTTIAVASAGASEGINATANTASVITGPFVRGDSGFDDEVYAPTNEELLDLCAQLTPAEAVNAALSDDFAGSGTTVDSSKFETTGSASPPSRVTVSGDGAARFTNATSYMATSDNYDFTPTDRPVYVSAYWTPVSSATQAGFSIVTRATPPPSSNDIFTFGITVRFDDRDAATSSTSGVANRIYICDNTTPTCTTGSGNRLAESASTYSLIAGQEYLLEVYDNSDDVWARITQVSNPLNTITVSYSFSTPTDLTGEQKVVFVNGVNQSDIDDVLIGVPMLAGDFNGITSYAEAAANTNMLGSNASLSLEAWINPDSYPSGSNAYAIVSKWDTATEGTPGGEGYRLYLNSGEIHLRLSTSDGVVRTFDSGFTPQLNVWTHVAATYDRASGTVRFYGNGELKRILASVPALSSVVDTNVQPLIIGADRNSGSAAHFFDGKISDVRVWNSARSANNIRTCYKSRVPSNACASGGNLIANFRLDPTPLQGGLFGDGTVYANVGTNATAANVSYAGALAIYFRPFSSDFCPTTTTSPAVQGTRTGAYQCEFRLTAQSTTTTGVALSIPNNLAALYVKAWGGGGGGYDASSNESLGGAGGFSEGLIQTIGGTSIAGINLDIVVGGGGTGSNSDTDGAGGGAASGIRRSSGMVIGLVAGGGGGASYASSTAGGGGMGGGVGVNAGDGIDPSGLCGGHGGNTASALTFLSPPSLTCLVGGADPSASNGNGASGGGTNVGGTSAIANGGAGYNATISSIFIGGGGGGGGYRISAVSGGGGEAGGYRLLAGGAGYGGGGGSAYADSGVANARGELGAASTSTITATDTSRIGDLQPEHASAVQRRRVDVSPNTTGLAVGSTISGTCIPNGTTIAAVVNGGTIEMSAQATGTDAACQNVALSIGVATNSTTYVAGDDDVDYAPSYATSLNPAPGRGGFADTIATNINGVQGAVVLKW
jgi:hypothetical protein